MTIFHFLMFAGMLCGVMFGAKVGGAFFGNIGWGVGGIVGALTGWCLGRIPLILTTRSLTRDFGRKTTEELRAQLRDEKWLAPNFVLLELKRRGEDIHQELDHVLDMLVSESQEHRKRAWHALASAFPDLARKIRDFRISDSVETCRAKVEKLRKQ